MTVGECVKLMRTHRVGSLLVIEPTTSARAGAIVGIFTERDLLMKLDRMGTWPQWERPVAQVMTKPVISLDLEDIEKAASLMLKNQIRHLPIVSRGGKNQEKTLVGILSMRDILSAYVQRGELDEVEESLSLRDFSVRKHLDVGLIARDFRQVSFVRQGLSKNPKVRIKPLVRSGMSSEGDPSAFLSNWLRSLKEPSGLEQLKALTAVVIDLDGWNQADWGEALKTFGALSGGPQVFVLFDPVAHSRVATVALNRLGKSSKFSVYSKPVNPLDFFWALETALRHANPLEEARRSR